jgi:predicted HTH transcriptional regulator
MKTSIGGYLLIGVKDSGLPAGIFDDDIEGSDNYARKVADSVKSALGSAAASLVDIVVLRMPSGEEICVVKCSPSSEPVMCVHAEYNGFQKKDKKTEIFYVRQSAQTRSLTPSEMLAYLKNRQFDLKLCYK